jgi:iron complex outermembrane receptor protein
LKNVVWIFIQFLALNTNAQISVKGNIIDHLTKKGIAGASVSLSDQKQEVTANTQGAFELSNIKSGQYLLEISAIGYQSQLTSILLYQDTFITIELSLAHKELSEIIITGVSRSTELKKNPIIAKTISRAEWQQTTATNIIDALKNVPGINQISTGSAISKPIIRGLGYNRVISLMNGLRQEGQQWGDEHGIEIDENAVDRIEIIKGPGSLMYGSDGIAGVVHFISPNAPSMGKIKTQFNSNYQSNNQLLAYSISNAGNINGYYWMGQMSQKIAGNFETPVDGKVLNSGYAQWNGQLALGIHKKWGHSELRFSTFNASINMPEGLRDRFGRFIFTDISGTTKTATENDLNGYHSGIPRQEIHHTRISSNSLFLLPKGTLHLDLGFQKNLRNEYGNSMNPNEVALAFDLNSFLFSSRYNFNKKNGWEISMGTSGMIQTNQNKGSEFIIPQYTMYDMGAFGYFQKSLNAQWTIAGGIRGDIRKIESDALRLDSLGFPTESLDSSTSLKFGALSKAFYGISGSIGVTYQIDPSSTLKLNISRGFRAPNISELRSNGRHEGTFRYELGNTSLTPEISHQIDLAFYHNSDHITFECTPFVNFISNYIYSNKWTDSMGQPIIIDTADAVPTYQFTQGNATLFGGELYLDIHPHPFDWLHIAQSFSYVRAIQSNASDSTKNLPFIPAPKYRVELKMEIQSSLQWLKSSYLKIALDHYFGQNDFYSANHTETYTPAYTLLSSSIGTQIKALGQKEFITISVNIENMANVAYQNHLSRLKYAPENPATGQMGIYNPGRNISLKMTVQF